MNCFDDQAKMTDALNSQKFITGNYNHYAGECATKEHKEMSVTKTKLSR